MPESAVLRVLSSAGQTMVAFGRMLVYRYDSDDLGMRNLAIVALTDAKQPVKDVAAAFGMTATYVSILRSRARAQGSAGLVRPRGRPSKLSARQVTQAREWASTGRSQQATADEFGVARSVLGGLLSGLGPAPVHQVLPPGAEPAEEPTEEPTGQAMGEPMMAQPELVPAEPAGPVHQGIAGFTGSSRIGTGTHLCRYAGAMLLHPLSLIHISEPTRLRRISYAVFCLKKKKKKKKNKKKNYKNIKKNKRKKKKKKKK